MNGKIELSESEALIIKRVQTSLEYHEAFKIKYRLISVFKFIIYFLLIFLCRRNHLFLALLSIYFVLMLFIQYWSVSIERENVNSLLMKIYRFVEGDIKVPKEAKPFADK